jgi:general secretion pathway protein A
MYNEFYGFSEKPFETTPDTRFLYLPSRHREALLSLIDAIHQRKRLITMVGPAGTGKTILVHALLNALEAKRIKAIHILLPPTSLKELLQRVALQLGSEAAKTKVPSLDQIRELLDPMSDDKSFALVIDEAHRIPEKVLAGLPALIDAKPQGVQILLIGQPELEDKLVGPGLSWVRGAISVRSEIGALSPDESEQYIRHRLRVVGNERSGLFTSEALALITSHGEGIPRLINTLCDNALIEGHRLFKNEIDASVVRKVVANMDGQILAKPLSRKPIHFRGTSKLRRAGGALLLALLCFGGALLLIGPWHGQKWFHPFLKSSESVPPVSQGISASPFSTPRVKQGLGAGDAMPNAEKKQGPAPSLGSFRPAGAGSMVLQPREEVITVEKGTNLFSLVQKYYGCADPMVIDLLLEVNPEIIDAHLIRAGQKIKLPRISEDSLISPVSDGMYKVHAATHVSSWKARRYVEEAGLKGRGIEIVPRKVAPQDDWYRVMIGDFTVRDEAVQMIRTLKKQGSLILFRGIAEKE